jgi:hypothetical protein
MFRHINQQSPNRLKEEHRTIFWQRHVEGFLDLDGNRELVLFHMVTQPDQTGGQPLFLQHWRTQFTHLTAAIGQCFAQIGFCLFDQLFGAGLQIDPLNLTEREVAKHE